MGRKHRRRPDPAGEPRPPGGGAPGQVERHVDGEWVVRRVSGAAATKAYRCPGCDQEIRPATPHVVAWPAGLSEEDGLADRRHWHSPCWEARGRRGPTAVRGRGPRY